MARSTQWEESSGKDLTELASEKQPATREGKILGALGVAKVRIL